MLYRLSNPTQVKHLKLPSSSRKPLLKLQCFDITSRFFKIKGQYNAIDKI